MPDITLTESKKVKLILDAKYKRLLHCINNTIKFYNNI